MGSNTRRYNKWKGYTLEDCRCEYCLYYSGKRRKQSICLLEECICKEEIEKACQRERSMENGSKN